MPVVNDLTGQKFGRLTAIKLDPERAPDRQARWHCRCDCGTMIVTKAGHLRSGKSRSCTFGGCRKGTTSKHPLYRRWLNMTYRCTKPTAVDFHNYGARGISVCARWMTFENFLSDMDPTFRPGLQLDRLDNDGNYEPSNCAWRTPKENSNNKRPRLRATRLNEAPDVIVDA